MKHESPFVGPRPFEKEDRDRFFGRTPELEELLSLIIAHRGVLVYAQSGAGKTSLLRAGVIPKLEEQKYKVLPPARVQGPIPDGTSPETIANIFVFHALQYWAPDSINAESAAAYAKTSLPEFLTRVVAVPSDDEEETPNPTVMIFDQFEEFFTTNADRWQERGPFFIQLAEALRQLPTLKVVLAMREEYIAQLEPFADLLPEKLRTRMHLQRLRGNAALTAVVKPFQSWGLSFQQNAAETLMGELSEIRVLEGDKFREARGEFVEPVQLQVVCQSLWEHLPSEWKNGADSKPGEPRLITPDYVTRFGDVNNALALYYDRSVEKAAQAGKIGEGELRRWIGSVLITPTGTRGLAFRNARGTPGYIPGLALKELEEAHVIRREERAGTITHELTHDRFIEPIQASNKAWLARYQELDRLRAKMEERAQTAPDEILNEVEIREAEQYLESPVASLLGATPAFRRLVARSKAELEERRTRELEKYQEAIRRAEEEKRLHAAESERVQLLLEKRKKERILGALVFLTGLLALIAVGTVSYIIKEKAESLAKEKRALAARGETYREKAKEDLNAKYESDPVKDVTALRNLSIALTCNREDTEAARLAQDLLMKNIWCPPAAPEVRYRDDALLAASFVPPGGDREVFAVAGNGNLLRWRENRLERERSLFEKPQPAGPQELLEAGFASFSPNGEWLLVIPPRIAAGASFKYANYANAAAQNVVQSAPPPMPGGEREDFSIVCLRWSKTRRTYEPAAPDLSMQRLISARTNFAWAPSSDRVVLINFRGTDTESLVLQFNENSVSELPNLSRQLSATKTTALAYSADGTRVAAVTSDRKVAFRRPDDFEMAADSSGGKTSFPLPEDFQPNGISFGPADDELSLSSWTGVRVLNTRSGGKPIPVQPPTFRDQFMRTVTGPGEATGRLVARALYGRIQVTRGIENPVAAEPVVFRGAVGIPQFSADGRQMLILSGGMINVFDTMRLIDLAQLTQPRPSAYEPAAKTKTLAAPAWLGDIASVISALDAGGDGSLLTLPAVRQRYAPPKKGDPYEPVWQRFCAE